MLLSMYDMISDVSQNGIQQNNNINPLYTE